jgi:hypothetical protein
MLERWLGGEIVVKIHEFISHYFKARDGWVRPSEMGEPFLGHPNGLSPISYFVLDDFEIWLYHTRNRVGVLFNEIRHYEFIEHFYRFFKFKDLAKAKAFFDACLDAGTERRKSADDSADFEMFQNELEVARRGSHV